MELAENDEYNTDGNVADTPAVDGRRGHLEEQIDDAAPQGDGQDEDGRQ
ncbi:MAG: hypothetical protein WKF82_11985 [Nocardioidaceae bacterium]